MGDLILQILKACVGGIEGTPLFQRIDSFLSDMPWRVKIRLAYTQGNSAFHFIYNIEKLPDPGRGDTYDFV